MTERIILPSGELLVIMDLLDSDVEVSVWHDRHRGPFTVIGSSLADCLDTFASQFHTLATQLKARASSLRAESLEPTSE